MGYESERKEDDAENAQDEVWSVTFSRGVSFFALALALALELGFWNKLGRKQTRR